MSTTMSVSETTFESTMSVSTTISLWGIQGLGEWLMYWPCNGLSERLSEVNWRLVERPERPKVRTSHDCCFLFVFNAGITTHGIGRGRGRGKRIFFFPFRRKATAANFFSFCNFLRGIRASLSWGAKDRTTKQMAAATKIMVEVLIWRERERDRKK